MLSGVGHLTDVESPSGSLTRPCVPWRQRSLGHDEW